MAKDNAICAACKHVKADRSGGRGGGAMWRVEMAEEAGAVSQVAVTDL